MTKLVLLVTIVVINYNTEKEYLGLFNPNFQQQIDELIT
jgi:hypothetical protein